MDRTADMMLVTQLIQAWGLHRDQGNWPELAAMFTVDGTISVTWFSGSHADFIEACRATHKQRSPRTKHLIGTPFVRITGDRAVAETSIQILGRATIAGVAVDNTSYARFVDRIVRAGDEWRISRRVAIYEKDRLDPVIPSPAFDRFMAETDFSDLPEPYRYLGFRLVDAGRTLRPDIIVDGSPEADRVLAEAGAWLASSA
jgi:hypothetical protein